MHRLHYGLYFLYSIVGIVILLQVVAGVTAWIVKLDAVDFACSIIDDDCTAKYLRVAWISIPLVNVGATVWMCYGCWRAYHLFKAHEYQELHPKNKVKQPLVKGKEGDGKKPKQDDEGAALTMSMNKRRSKLPSIAKTSRSGAECSLCEVAKQDLAAVQRIAPFHLSLYNIRRQEGDDPDEYNRTAWRRLYQYDIPVLHRGRATDFSALAGRANTHGQLIGGRVMKHRVDKDRLAQLSKHALRSEPPTEPTAFFVDLQPEIVDGASRQAEHLYDYITTGSDSYDVIAILGESPQPAQAAALQGTGRACFNCRGDHVLSECPFHHDKRIIAANRAIFREEESGRTLGSLGIASDTDKSRAFLQNFKPGRISADLYKALGMFGGSDAPFYWKMRDFGYPPGWVAGKDPLEAVSDLIGRDLDLASVPMLKVHDFDKAFHNEEDDGSVVKQLGSFVSSYHRPSVALLPSSPPPPLPQVMPPVQRWACFETRLFDWRTLPVYDPYMRACGTPVSLSRTDRVQTLADDESVGEADMDFSDDE
ncbi:hypothetical protein OIV83_002423 [Microbotryomycetes sp. JL201]|nr:hypothetical protein OIV83_002423 [Microbotryomycetes sp. JL201]